MKTFLSQLKWQFVLLQKNNIISISLGVTIIYGLILFFLSGMNSLDQFLVALVMNDPSVIGYFFIGLAIYTEIKYQILTAVLVTPVNLHLLIITKVVALTIIGVVCSVGLAISVLGVDFNILAYTIGSLGICLLSALLGIVVLTYASEFLKFTMLSVPIFLVFINVPLLQYFVIIDMGLAKYILPVQGCLDLIDFAVSGTPINHWMAYSTIAVYVPIFYWLAYKRFHQKVVA